MSTPFLTIHDRPQLTDGCLILGFSGWMDGGEVSTGTIDYLAMKLPAIKVAEIEPSTFYIYNFPGSMEVSSLFRPRVTIENGLITDIEEPGGIFYCNPSHNIVLFNGKEPNLRWPDYAECMFTVAQQLNVRRILFVGSVAGLVPHTRDSRVFTSASDKELLAAMRRLGLLPSNYEGPGSFVSYLTTLAQRRGFELATLVVEIPAYVEGRNVKCIEAIVRKLKAASGMDFDSSDLVEATRGFEKRLSEIVRERPELEELVAKMEADYDQEVNQSMSDDLKAWLERQGIRLD